MRSVTTRSIRCLAVALLSLAVLPLRGAPEEPSDKEKKPNLMHRLFGGGDKDTKEEPKAPPPEAKKPSKPKPSESAKEDPPAKPKSKLKLKVEDNPPAKPKSAETASKPKSNEPAKPKPKPEPEKKPTTTAKTTEAPKKSAEPPAERKPDATPTKERSLDSEFGKTTGEMPAKLAAKASDQPPTKPTTTVTESPTTETPASDTNVPLPPIDSAFEIVKSDGRDYVTADSMHRFYRFSSFKMDGKHVILSNPTLILKAEIGSQELFMNNIKFTLSYPATIVSGKAAFSRLDLCKMIDPVLLPSHITDADPFDTVVVDAGHGGHDSGARGVYGYEKDFTLQMAQSVRNALIARGLKVVMTRSTDEFITLGGRAAIANATPRSIFVSLHFNSSGPAATGIETFALSPQGASSTFMGQRSSDFHSYTGNHQDSANIALATAVHAMVIHRFKFVDRGIKRARWSVLTGCNRPGILFEGGFVTNATECRLIASTTYRESVAQAIGDAIVNYRRALQPRMAQPSQRR